MLSAKSRQLGPERRYVLALWSEAGSLPQQPRARRALGPRSWPWPCGSHEPEATWAPVSLAALGPIPGAAQSPELTAAPAAETSQGGCAWEQALGPLTAPGFQVHALQGSESWPGLSAWPAPFWSFPFKSWAIRAIFGAPQSPKCTFTRVFTATQTLPSALCRGVQPTSTGPWAVLHTGSSPDPVWEGSQHLGWSLQVSAGFQGWGGTRGGSEVGGGGGVKSTDKQSGGSLLSPFLPFSFHGAGGGGGKGGGRPYRPPLSGDG